MNRRKFIKAGSVAGLGISSLSVIPTPSFSEPVEPAAPASVPFPLNEITIDELQRKMQSGEYTARSIAEMYLKRIEGLDKSGLQIGRAHV